MGLLGVDATGRWSGVVREGTEKKPSDEYQEIDLKKTQALKQVRATRENSQE